MAEIRGDVPDRLAAALAAHRPEPTRVLVAVSGGADSVGLLCAWAELLRRGARTDVLAVAHFDHGLRPDSAADAAWVAERAAELGVPCHAGVWGDRPAAPSEAAARAARYRFLGATAAACGAETVATAHSGDDQAETVLLALLRGAGMHGLAGMQADRPLPFDGRVRLLRPLLGERRAALRAYLTAQGLAWREDATNADPRFRRNRLRRDLLPKLRAEFNPRVDEALVRLAGHARAAAAALDAAADEFFRLHAAADALPLAALRALPPEPRANLFRRWWALRGWPRGRMGQREWQRLANWVDSPSRGLQLPAGVVVRKRRGLVHFAAPGTLLTDNPT